MKKLLFLPAILILFFLKTKAQSNFIQFSQAPVNLNPALAGAADQLRLTVASNVYQTEINSISYLGPKNKVEVNHLGFSVDQFVSKLSSGIGFYCMANRQLFFDRRIPEIGTVINMVRKSYVSSGLSIAPKFTLKRGKEFKHTISPSLELNTRYYNVTVNSENANEVVMSRNITNWQIGYRLGLSIVYNKSVFGFVIGNSYFTGQPSLQMPYTSFYGSWDPYIYESGMVNTKRTIKPYKNRENSIAYSTHYGYTFTLSKPKDISLTLQAYVFLSSGYSNYSEEGELDNGFSYNEAMSVLNTNFRYQKMLLGLAYSIMIKEGIIGSIGYQSRHLKTIISTDFKKLGEVTCSYVF